MGFSATTTQSEQEKVYVISKGTGHTFIPMVVRVITGFVFLVPAFAFGQL